MLSEFMDLHALSPSSYFYERQVGFWKTDSMPENHGEGMLQAAGSNLFASSRLDNRMFVDSSLGKCIDIPSIHLVQNQQTNPRFDKHLIGMERVARLLDHDSRSISNLNTNPVSYFTDGQKANMMDPCYEDGLFSSPLSQLLSQKMTLSPSDAQNGHFVPATSNSEEEELFESLEEIEAQTIGNLLPNDDDLLLGVTDGFDYITRPSGGDDIEDLDFFSSVVGLDLGEEQKSCDISTSRLGGSSGSIAGEHPSRTLFVRNININVEDVELRAIFGQYGDIRTLYTACKHRGFVMISYYDLRAAQNAMKALQNKALMHRKLDIHFSIPKDNPLEKDSNRGTLAVSKLDFAMTNDELRQLFGVYGDIKEIRDVPHRCHHKSIEFYDVRAAEAAFRALSRSELAGKLELRHPDGYTRFMQSFPELKQDEFGPYLQQSSSHNLTTGFGGPVSHGQITSFSMENSNRLGVNYSTAAPVSQYQDIAFQHGISSSVPRNLSSVIRAELLGQQSSITDSGHLLNKKSLEIPSTPIFHPQSLPDYYDDSVFSSTGNESYAPPPPHHYMWNNSPEPHGMMWSNSPSYVNGICSPQHLQKLHTIHRTPYHMLNTNLPINSHQAGSAPSVDPTLWDKRPVYAGETPDASYFQPGSLGNMRITSNSLHPLEFVPPNIFPGFGGNCLDLPIASKILQSPQQSSKMFLSSAQMYPRMSPFDSPHERLKGRRNEGVSSQADSKKQYELDIDRIIRGEDQRTTLMIKNIPNKYTSKMLLAAIDEHHRGTYDFIYLPIDFKNKCNVGYAFINMTDPSLIIPFSQAFNGKKWEKFNSEKVASLAYARIQGKASLIAHFQNSSLMNEDKRCRPILFNTEGPNAGDQVILYRSGLVTAAASFVFAASTAFLPDHSFLTDLIKPNFDLLYALGAAGLGLSLFLIHIYVTEIKRTLQLLWSLGVLGSLATSFTLAEPAGQNLIQYVADHPTAVWLVGPLFAAFTGLVFKEGLCYGKLEAGVLTFVVPAVLLGHLTGLMDDGLKITLIGLWMALFVVFAGRKFTQPIKDDIGDKSVFIFNSLPEEEKKLVIEKLERKNYTDETEKD